MRIRKAGVSDLDTIVGFQVKMAAETENLELNISTLKNGVLAVLQDPAKGFYHLAEEGNKTVACHMVTFEWSDWRNTTIYWIQSLYVIPEYRRRGVFKEMFSYLKQRAMELPGVGGIRLYVVNTNEKAQLAYAEVGMDGEHYRMFEWMKSK